MRFVCPKCKFEIKTSRKKHVNSCDGFGPRRLKETKFPGKRGGWNKGKKLNEIFDKEKEENIRFKMSKNHKGGGKASTPEKEIIRRKKISEAILKRYNEGWESTAGRTKKIKYISLIAGEVLIDGRWELAVCEYLDKHNIKWKRNKKRFPYIYENKNRTYCPDFYLIDSDIYIEVKGYQTNLDNAKWEQFRKELEVWDKKVLREKGILS